MDLLAYMHRIILEETQNPATMFASKEGKLRTGKGWERDHNPLCG